MKYASENLEITVEKGDNADLCDKGLNLKSFCPFSHNYQKPFPS